MEDSLEFSLSLPQSSQRSKVMWFLQDDDEVIMQDSLDSSFEFNMRRRELLHDSTETVQAKVSAGL
jgi:hypothetical protein